MRLGSMAGRRIRHHAVARVVPKALQAVAHGFPGGSTVGDVPAQRSVVPGRNSDHSRPERRHRAERQRVLARTRRAWHERGGRAADAVCRHGLGRRSHQDERSRPADERRWRRRVLPRRTVPVRRCARPLSVEADPRRSVSRSQVLAVMRGEWSWLVARCSLTAITRSSSPHGSERRAIRRRQPSKHSTEAGRPTAGLRGGTLPRRALARARPPEKAFAHDADDRQSVRRRNASDVRQSTCRRPSSRATRSKRVGVHEAADRRDRRDADDRGGQCYCGERRRPLERSPCESDVALERIQQRHDGWICRFEIQKARLQDLCEPSIDGLPPTASF